MRNLDLAELDRCGLLDPIHISIIHMIDLVGRTCGQNGDALKDRDDELGIQTSLQEGVQRRLLDDFLKFVELDTFADPTSDFHIHVVEFDAEETISHT